jgi:peroxiredoxin 2/4
MSLVGKKFPNITVDAISFMGDNLRINVLEEATKNKKKVILFWYPKDFTFVCPTELHAFQNGNRCFLRYKRSALCMVKHG